jgi:hypothetical protein
MALSTVFVEGAFGARRRGTADGYQKPYPYSPPASSRTCITHKLPWWLIVAPWRDVDPDQTG